MEYVQERVTTLHDFGDASPTGPLDRTTVVVPLTARDHASLAAERVFETLATLDPARVVVALRASPAHVGDVAAWLGEFELDSQLLWCTAPGVETLLEEHGLGGAVGKGRDVWLGLGQATETDFVAVHDADASSYGRANLHRLTTPLARDFRFVKAYYARVESDRLYGRLCRLFAMPILDVLADRHDSPLLGYLAAFRYPLAGEFAATADVARQLRVPRGWGLELDILGQAHALAGASGAAQVDLGVHEHEHRSVTGPEGLGDMAEEVAASLFHVLADAGIDVDYESLGPAYRRRALALVDQYAEDAAFNGLTYDRQGERVQVDRYAAAIAPPGPDDRLPAWADTALSPAAVADASRVALEGVPER